MNAGTVQCKCGVHYTARDPHSLCQNCPTRSCSRSLPCSYCTRLSSTEWDLCLGQEVKTRAVGSKRFPEESSSPATEGLGVTGFFYGYTGNHAVHSIMHNHTNNNRTQVFNLNTKPNVCTMKHSLTHSSTKLLK